MKIKKLFALIAFLTALFAGLVSAQPTFAGESNGSGTTTPTPPPYHPNGLIWES